MAPLIRVRNLEKRFVVAPLHRGMRTVFRRARGRNRQEITVVDRVGFDVSTGEMVAYVGPNGAGKSTTIKMLTGVLVPSGGEVMVDGLVPYRQRTTLASRIGVVFGQRSQLWWDLPLLDSLQILRHMYKLPEERYYSQLKRISDVLDLGPILYRPVRQLSLGQRMRGELAAAILHQPKILFLDEPTIGLDVVAKERIHALLIELNQQFQITMILTTHQLADIPRLCQRLMILDKGSLIYDGGIAAFTERYGGERRLVIDIEDADRIVGPELFGARLERREGNRLWLAYQRDQVSTPELIGHLMSCYAVRDLMLEELDIESIIHQMYSTQFLNIEQTSTVMQRRI